MALLPKGRTASNKQGKRVQEDSFREQKVSLGIWSYEKPPEAY